MILTISYTLYPKMIRGHGEGVTRESARCSDDLSRYTTAWREGLRAAEYLTKFNGLARC